MRQQEAEDLLNKTFNQDFKIEKFSQFIKELFNEIHINIEDKTSYIGKQYKDHISDLKKLGEYRDNDRKRIEVLAVKLERPSSLDRARTMQRNFIANWLGKIDAEGALVAFYDDEHPDWRFSFVKMEYNLVRDEGGKVKVAQKLTPARRYSYLVGVNEPNHTCRRQFLDLVKDEISNPALSDLEQAFSIESVTKEFFEKYKELVFDLKESIDKVVDQNEIIKKEFDEKLIKPVDFAKKLLGQIVFLYFLQKKGWLGVEKGEKWGTGPHNFLRKLFGDKKKGINPLVSYDNFFNEILKLLFYDALAHERPGDDGYYPHFKCKIPFLNGGLFEPLNDYDWIGTEILIENDVFEKIFKVFDRFNFTVKEDEPLDKEVAVDPEMLGKVFENLLELKERKDKGAFYTPREIVHYMCQQSLINYLKTNIDIKREDIETFIQYGDLALEHVIKDLEQQKTYNGQSYVDEEFLIPESISYNFRKIDRLLKNIKIVDPAVGSGAFPVGMMNEIVKARSILTIYFSEEEQKERTNYNLKRETIANSLYGVDIDQSGAEIAKLRFWLSLIVDETDMNKIKPLPNLDHKVMCGNSLLEKFEGIKLFDDKLLGSVKKDKQEKLKEIDEQILDLNDHLSHLKSIEIGKKRSIAADIKKLRKKREKVARQAASESTEQISLGVTESEKKIKTLRGLQKKYFSEQNRKNKRELRSKIDMLEWDLIEVTLKEQNHGDALEKLEQYRRTKVKPFFLWKLYFAEVFQRENPGFDVVIANPPYVDSENMVKETPELRKIYAKKFPSAKGNWDLFIVFINQGLNLLRKRGVISYIVPNKLIGAKYSETLKEILKEKRIIEIRDYSSVDVFKEADVYPVTFVISDDLPNNEVTMTLMDDITLVGNINIIPPEIFYADIDWARYFVRDKRALDLVLKLSKNDLLVKSFPNVSGAATVNEAYKLKEIMRDDKNHIEATKKFINTGTIDPYISLWGHKITRYIKQGYQYPIVHDSDLKKFSNTRYQQACSEKIIIGGMTKNLECFYDSGRYLAGKSTTIILPGSMNLTVLVAFLNSKLVSFWYRIFFKSLSLSGGYIRIGNNEIKRIPLAITNEHINEKIKKNVNRILEISNGRDFLEKSSKKKEIEQLKTEIDKLIYTAYKLTPDEIEIVEDFVNKKNKD
jgi:hypothetical protein